MGEPPSPLDCRAPARTDLVALRLISSPMQALGRMPVLTSLPKQRDSLSICHDVRGGGGVACNIIN